MADARLLMELRKRLPGKWSDSVTDDGHGAAIASADPSDQHADWLDIRDYGDGYSVTYGAYNEARGIGDVVEETGPYRSSVKAAKVAADLVRKHHGERTRGDYMQKRNYGRSQPFGSALDRGETVDPEFDLGFGGR